MGFWPENVDMTYGFLFSDSSMMQANANDPVIEGAEVSAGRGAGRVQWRLGTAAGWSPPSRDRAGFRRTRTGNTDRCFYRDSRRMSGCCATSIRGGDKPLEPVRLRFHWRQIPAVPAPRQGSPGHAPLGSQRLTCVAPTNREEELVVRNTIPIKHAQNLPGIPCQTGYYDCAM